MYDQYLDSTQDPNSAYALGGSRSTSGTNANKYRLSQYAPNDQQKEKIATDTWNIYNTLGDNKWSNWTPTESNPYQVKGVAGDNGVDFYWRIGNEGEGQKYGTLNPGVWGGGADQSAMLSDANNFWNQSQGQFGDFWGDYYGFDPVGQNTGTLPTYDNQFGDTQSGETYTPPSDVSSSTGDAASQYGFGVAQQLLNQAMNANRDMPGWWGNNYASYDPNVWKDQYPGFVANPTLEQGALPGDYQRLADYTPQSYKGLMAGDYDKLQQALTEPGKIAAEEAYKTGLNDLKGFMGNNGMYGSSVMANQANQGINKQYMNANAINAANAAAQRYGLQQNDLQYGNTANMQDRQFADRANRQDRQFGANYGLQLADLERQRNLDQWKAGVTNASNVRDYNNQKFQFDFGNSEMARGEHNNLAQNKYNYDMQRAMWDAQNNEQLMNQALALAGRGAPLTTAAMNYRNQQDLMDAKDNAAMWGLGTQLLGSFFGGGGGGWQNSMAKTLWDSWS